jgi:hypothetical protein
MFWFLKKKIKDIPRKTEKVDKVENDLLKSLYFDTDSEFLKNETLRKVNDKFGTGGRHGFK